MGSCFAEHISQRLEQYKFKTYLNPFGILYNPVSIAWGLEFLLSKASFGPEDVFLHQTLWHSFRHHGAFSHPDRDTMVDQLNEHLQLARTFLGKTTKLIITLGTAYGYVHRASGEVVANCHQLPAQHFAKEMLDPVAIQAQLGKALQMVKSRRPDLQVLLTVSPIRHIRDGLIENNRSKARLLLVAEKLEQALDWVHYFPSYELVLDDLRDYRFFKDDLVHPSAMAVDYVWDHFAQALFREETVELIRQIEKIRKASAHRPFHPESTAHQAFLRKQLLQIDQLESVYPFLDFVAERRAFTTQISNP